MLDDLVVRILPESNDVLDRIRLDHIHARPLRVVRWHACGSRMYVDKAVEIRSTGLPVVRDCERTSWTRPASTRLNANGPVPTALILASGPSVVTGSRMFNHSKKSNIVGRDWSDVRTTVYLSGSIDGREPVAPGDVRARRDLRIADAQACSTSRRRW